MLLEGLFLSFINSIIADTKIIGGNYASPGQFPHQISLQLNNRHHCGGSIISPNAILTAAHCTINQSPSSLKVIAGTNDLNAAGLQKPVFQLITHPQYSNITNDYDISVVLLGEELKFNEMIKPIHMTESSDNADADTIAIISGFGAINNNLDLPDKLKYANIQLWSRAYCNPQNIPGITDRMICGGHPSGQVSACQGDSGGPLMVNEKLFGIVSWGFGCGAPGRPAIYTFVGSMRPWIKKVAEV